MGRLHFYILLVEVFLLGISESTIDGYRNFRVGRLERKLEDSTLSEFERQITQKLDHFNPNDEREWQQRYFVNDEFYNKTSNNVVFLRIAGEEEARESWMTNGAWYLFGKDFQTILFQLEHRYYGKNRPTNDTSTENLVYLTSEQALADAAFFIKAMNKEHNFPSDVKWILFGGSYAGSLVAWMRLKYPDLVHGAVSSSGPLLAKLDFPEYFGVVQEALRVESEECANAVHEGTRQIDTLLLDVAGQRIVNDKLRLCDNIEDNINNELDVSLIYQALANDFAGVVQYNNDNRGSSSNVTVATLCAIMTNETLGKEIDRLAAVDTLIFGDFCLGYKYDDLVAYLRNDSWEFDASAGTRQWLYQTCNEFGFYQTSNFKPQIFGDRFGLDFYVQKCQDAFGPKFNRTFMDNAVERTNKLYGGLDIKVDNVVFVHGSLDPWHDLGLTQSQNKKSPAILIEGAAHVANIYNPSDKDTPQLKAARVQIKDFIAKLLL